MTITPTPTASITLANGCVVRVGDVVPMTDGEVRTVESIAPDALRLQMLRRVNIAHLYDKGGVRISDPDHPARIDLAKLAEQQAAQPAGATVRELVERWRERARLLDIALAANPNAGLLWIGEAQGGKKAIDTCAAELAAALPGGMKEGQRREIAEAWDELATEIPTRERWARLRAALSAAGLLGGKDG